MQNLKSNTDRPLWCLRIAACLAVSLLLAGAAGCGSAARTTTGTTTTSSSVVDYFAPRVAGANHAGSLLTGPQIYAFDSTNSAFYFQLIGSPIDSHVLDVGSYASGKRSLLDLSISTSYANSAGTWVATPYSPAEAGGYAMKLGDNTGGLIQMIGQPVAPVVAATACPSSTTAQTYLFVSIPGSMSTASGVTPLWGWNPSADTAYGSVDISANGSDVTFKNIKQYTLSAGTPTYPSDSTVIGGACGATSSGYLTVVPGDYEEHVSPTGATAYPAQASIGIGSSGLLVEDNGTSSGTSWYNYTTLYENILGAGTGAIGLPKPSPSSALDTSALVGAQYQGFIYNSGYYDKGTPTAWSSHVASFGFASTPSSCSEVAKSTSTMIYGGEYANGDPSNPGNSSDGYDKCDFAIDLGTPDATSNNGLYPNVTVWVGSDYAVNSAKTVYHFSAVAIAGKLNGKYAIFLIGADATQPWAVYLLSN